MGISTYDTHNNNAAQVVRCMRYIATVMIIT